MASTGIAQHVHDLGMQFGLWFEPEMVNLDSDCAREHPDWILAAPEAVPYREDVSYRTQYVLDLANPDAYRHVHDQMAALVEQLGIDYIKWDHNRDVTEPVHDGRYGLHEQTLACYRLFDDLKNGIPEAGNRKLLFRRCAYRRGHSAACRPHLGLRFQ